MSKLVFNRDGGKTDEFGHLLALMRFMQGEVIEGLQVAANGTPNMSVNVPYGVAAIPTGSGATGYRYFVGLDATENVAIPTANGSNPRNDLIVLWVDKSVTPLQSITNNNNNMLKISVVSGAPASTPADPNVAAIQAAIGAANPYIILARVVTGAGVTQINTGNITDLRSLTSVGRLLTNQIVTAYINDLAVTTAKIANLAVTNGKIAATAVSNDKIDWSTITAAVLGGINSATGEQSWGAGVFQGKSGSTVNFTTKKANQQVVFLFSAQYYQGGAGTRVRVNIDNGVQYSDPQQINTGLGSVTTAAQMTFFVMTIPTAGAHTVWAEINAGASGLRVIDGEGACRLAVIGL